MAYNVTVDQLIGELLALDQTPISQQTFSNTTIATFMDDELQNTICPIILRIREEFFVTSYQFVVGIQGTQNFNIPDDTYGFRIRDLYLYNQSANPNLAYKAVRVNPDTLASYNGALFPAYAAFAYPQYYIENNVLKFYPNITATYNADLRVMKQPNHLQLYLTCAGQVLAKLGGNVVQVDNVPQAAGQILPNGTGDWTKFTGVNATTLDVLQPVAPFNFRVNVNTQTNTIGGQYPLINRPIIGVSGANITLDNDTYQSIQPGDYLVTNQTSPFVQYVPYGAMNLLKYGTSMRILKAQGDLTNLAITASLYNSFAQSFLDTLTPKVENQPKKIGGGNRGALLGNLGGFYGRF